MNGGIHNTDQSMMLPLFYQGELVCWVSSTVHEGENGACEPGGMPAAAESKYDEGIKMSPFKVVENFQLKRDLVTCMINNEKYIAYEFTKPQYEAMEALGKALAKYLPGIKLDYPQSSPGVQNWGTLEPLDLT